jgi:predicted HAD superfamily Cof-like phosphohydrolase
MLDKETFVADVRRFTELAGCTTDQFNVRQTALYIGLQLEEMAEKLEAVFSKDAKIVKTLEFYSGMFKDGDFDHGLLTADRQALLDADVDLAWVTIGSMLSQGADVLGAMKEVARANLDKFPNGAVTKDANGKVVKPNGWRGPDLSPFVNGNGK